MLFLLIQTQPIVCFSCLQHACAWCIVAKRPKISCTSLHGHCVSCLIVRLHQDCNHVAAVLFKMDAAWKAGMTNPSCTSTKCVWNQPAGSQKDLLEYRCVHDMIWDKPMYNKKVTGSF